MGAVEGGHRSERCDSRTVPVSVKSFPTGHTVPEEVQTQVDGDYLKWEEDEQVTGRRVGVSVVHPPVTVPVSLADEGGVLPV